MTAIEWTNIPGYKGETWNPVVGCTVLTPGCTNCYAMKWAGGKLLKDTPAYKGLTRDSKAGPVWTGEIRTFEDRLTQPLRWKKPRSIFVNSMGDLFHEDIPDEWIDKVFAVAALCPRHIFIILTKRAERMRDYMTGGDPDLRIIHWAELGADWFSEDTPRRKKVGDGGRAATPYEIALASGMAADFPLPNVWLGVSVEDQTRAEERIPHLLDTPAAKRLVSCEPLLGNLEIERYLQPMVVGVNEELTDHMVLDGWSFPGGDGDHPGLDWVITGGESGLGARPMHPDWARGLRDQCQAAGVPFFFKQWGEWAPGECAEGPPTRTERCAWWWDDRWDYGQITPRVSEELHRDDAPDVWRLGKKRAGHLLDGEKHFNWPTTQHAEEAV